jgi:hypothetical protein
MLNGMIKVQALTRLQESIISQALNPNGPICNDQGAGRLPQPASACFAVHLFS